MIRDILAPLGGTGDDDLDMMRYKNIDSENEYDIKEIIRERIKPYFEERPENYRSSLRKSLSFFLTTNKIDYKYVFDSCLIAFDHPSEPRKFFLWIWEVLFPDQDYRVSDIYNYMIVDDSSEPNQYSFS
jgi:hypothetical protein